MDTPPPDIAWTAFQEHKYFEDSFQIYERGVAIFKYPHVRAIWHTYLTEFVKRYKGKKLERTRDMFEQAISQVTIVVLPTVAGAWALLSWCGSRVSMIAEEWLLILHTLCQ